MIQETLIIRVFQIIIFTASWIMVKKKFKKVIDLFEKTKQSFCFCCKSFFSNPIILARNDFNDWRHISQILKRHEKSLVHFDCYSKWAELKINYKKTL